MSPVPKPRQQTWWYCKECLAINDGLSEGMRCWNCNRWDRGRNIPWVVTRPARCQVCQKPYLVWILPAGTYMDDEYELGLCRDYFKHYGTDAYFPPMLPLEYMLAGNGWAYFRGLQRPRVREKADFSDG